MSAPLPHAVTVTRAVEAWHALSEHGEHTAAAAALGTTHATQSSRCRTYRKLHGLPKTAKPWDPSGVLNLICPRKDPRLADVALDTLLALLEHAEGNGEDELALHVRRHLHRLEARVYGAGVGA